MSQINGSVSTSPNSSTAGQRLRESEELYRTLIEIAAEAIVWFDDQFRIRLVNSYAAEVVGYAAEAMIGQPADITTDVKSNSRGRSRDSRKTGGGSKQLATAIE